MTLLSAAELADVRAAATLVANAAILALNAPAIPDAYGDTTGAGAAYWTGSHPARLRTAREEIANGREVTEGVDTTLTVWAPPAALLAAVPGPDATGHTVLISDRRSTPVSRRFRVVAVEHRAPGTGLDSLRLELADEQAP